MVRLFLAFIAASVLLYGGLHLLGRHDRMAARVRAGQSVVTTDTAAPTAGGATNANTIVTVKGNGER